MGIRASRPCRECSSLAVDNGLCAAHAARAKERERERKSDPIQKMYGWADWQVTRAAVFFRDPMCVVCGRRVSTQADHHPLSAREIVARFGTAAFFDPVRSRGLCASCHSAKTRGQGR